MVVKMMRWRPWPPLSTKKFEAKIIVKSLRGFHMIISPENGAEKPQEVPKLAVEIKWKGSKGNALSSLRRSIRRNFTREESLREEDDGVGVVEWNEEFQCVCNNFIATYKDGAFHPWEVVFTLLNGLNQAPSGKLPILATAVLNIADFTSAAEEKDIEISIPLQIPNCNNDNSPSLCLSLRLLELRTAQEPSDVMQRRCVSLLPTPEVLSAEKTEVSPFMAGLSKVKIFKGLSSTRPKKASPEDEGSDGPNSIRSEDVEYNYPIDTDSPGDMDEGEIEEEEDLSFSNSFNYGTLAYANHAGESFYSNSSGSENEDWIYYSHCKSDIGSLYTEGSPRSVLDEYSQKSLRHRILPWKKRRLSFKANKTKGEPLLKKYYGEEGGDDIDFDRRQFSSSDESTVEKKTDLDSSANRPSFSEFGDDNFAVGSWEQKEITSRDGHMKLQTKVFFASIDQRNEKAAGESACTALVAVIADWFQCNQDEMPIKSQLDSLIREGSFEWRNLCENETYGELFPDKHFDLDTVIQAKVRPLTVVPEKSFIGFFHPEGIEDGGFDFLQGAMSFDNIWDEISQPLTDSPTNRESMVYIVSWNDHFFILKVERDAYYIIDTLGERLYEGCTQAFILKFDKDTTIKQVANKSQQPNETPSDKVEQSDTKEAVTEKSIAVSTDASTENEEELTVVCRGKESCKEYIKNFLAAIPIRELQVDLKKGLMASTPLHHRLQIEFHYTKRLQQEVESFSEELTPTMPAVLPPEDGGDPQDLH